MNVIEKKLTEIKPYERNPRRNDEAVKYVAESISKFGFKNPILIDKNGVIVAGHTRFKAAKQLGMTEVPCVVADDLNDEQIKAFRLADNKVGEIATWDFELLHLELDDLEELDIDMSDFGFYNAFDENEFDNLFESQAAQKEEKTEGKESTVHWKVIIQAMDEDEALRIRDELREQGYECEVSA